MKTEVVSIQKLKFWKDNPRKNDHVAEKLAPLIKEHGFKSPLVVWKKDMTVYKGNTTLKAAIILKLKEVPVHFVDFKDYTSAVAYAIADNKSSDFSEWDDKTLVSLLSQKELLGKNTGFDSSEIKRLISVKERTEKTDSLMAKTIILLSSPADKELVMKKIDKFISECGIKTVSIS